MELDLSYAKRDNRITESKVAKVSDANEKLMQLRVSDKQKVADMGDLVRTTRKEMRVINKMLTKQEEEQEVSVYVCTSKVLLLYLICNC